MEKFSLTLPSASLPQSVDSSTVCGVVSSGNLEILVEPAATPGACQFMVNTSAHGFRDIWEAVLQ